MKKLDTFLFLILIMFATVKGEGQTKNESINIKDSQGAVIRINPQEKNIFLVFTADSRFEGGEHIIKVLDKFNIKGSFFFTGNFLRNKGFKQITKKIIKQGHYVGAHSDRHLLYCDWNKRDSLLITKEEFENDLKNNFRELKKYGIKPEDAKYFMPPYEWYNHKIVEWSSNFGLKVVNFTPGTGTNADYTIPEMKNYKSSVKIYANLLQYEKEHPDGLNGAILLFHPGTAPERADKLYNILEDIIRHLTSKRYKFESLTNLCRRQE